MYDFTDRVVVVTGGSGNLGSALVRCFQTSGAHTVIVDRNLDRIKAVFPGLVGSKEHLFAGDRDVMDPNQMEQLAQEILARFGRVDVLVNTVGGYQAGVPLHETPLDSWDFLMNLNARSVFIVSRAMIPAMLKQSSGRIINISSRSGLAAQGNDAIYSAAKSAVLRLSESMSAEYKHHGIRVNAILPSALVSPEDVQADPTRGVTPDSVAEVVMFLCSEAGSAITGALIPVFGERF